MSVKESVLEKLTWQEDQLPKSLTVVSAKITTADLLSYGAGVIILVIGLFALFPGWIAPYSPTEMAVDSILQPPSLAHLFGTDYFGRDVFSVVVHGSRDSLLIGMASVLIGGLLGSALGALAGYRGGFTDKLIMRFIEVLMTIPGILLALAIAASLGPSLFNIILAVSLASIPRYARVLRAQIMSIKERPYIMAAHATGTAEVSIFFHHILPNAWSPLLVMATIGLGTSILVGAGLSFLGLGVIKEIPDWGTLLSQGRGYVTVAWWMSTFPGLVITLLVVAVNLLGDRLRDQLDPQQSKV